MAVRHFMICMAIVCLCLRILAFISWQSLSFTAKSEVQTFSDTWSDTYSKGIPKWVFPAMLLVGALMDFLLIFGASYKTTGPIYVWISAQIFVGFIISCVFIPCACFAIQEITEEKQKSKIRQVQPAQVSSYILLKKIF